MGRTSAEVKNRWSKKAYDQLRIVVPKGLKEQIEAHAQEKGLSLNGYVNGLIREDMGVPEAQWKRVRTDGDEREMP